MRALTPRLLLTLLACQAAPAFAVGVHKWIDEQGVTHYSDEAPEAIETTLIDLPDPVAAAPGEDGSEDYYSISKQWERMNRERLEREKIQLEKAKIDAARRPPPQPVVYVQDSDDERYIPVYRDFRYRKHRGYRGHYRPYPATRGFGPMPAPPLTGGFPTR